MHQHCIPVLRAPCSEAMCFEIGISSDESIFLLIVIVVIQTASLGGGGGGGGGARVRLFRTGRPGGMVSSGYEVGILRG